MKSVHHAGRIIGSINLKGKKSKILSCGCCEIINLRAKSLKDYLIKELKEYKIKIR